MRSLQKIPSRLRGTNFCTSSSRFVLSFVRQPNDPECTQIVRNGPNRQFRVQWGRSGAFVAKNSDATLFTNFCTVRPVLHRVSCGNQTVPNAPKWYKTHQNVSLGSNGADQMRSLRKILTRLCGTNFCNSSAHFALSFIRQPNGPKCIQIVQNTPKYEFRVQCGGSGAFLRKIPTRLRGTNFCTSFARFALSVVTQPNGPKSTKIV